MSADPHKGARILVVDDRDSNVRLLEMLLGKAGYRDVTSVTDSREALALYDRLQPDILLLDLQMPHMDGFAIMEGLSERVPEDAYVPVVVLTADISPETKHRALAAGARDFLTKPFDHAEVLLRVGNLLETRALHQQLRNQNALLEMKVRERTAELEEAHQEILERLALAAEYRDDATGQHTQRVGALSALIAAELGMGSSEVELIRRAAPLHDVGKIAIADSILLKPGPLSSEEFEIMKTHSSVGGRMLSGGRFAMLQMAEEICLTHHERWDGSGYRGLTGEEIPMAGRIVAVADVFDALTHDRPYKKAWSDEDSIREIADQAGRQFDPDVVAAFLRAVAQPKHPFDDKVPAEDVDIVA